MKRFITMSMLFSVLLSYSQTYTSSFEPRSMNYHLAQAQLRGEQINWFVNNLSEMVVQNLNQNIDSEFRNDLLQVNSYITLLQGDTEMSVLDAEYYANKAKKLYNKAVRKYNKRLKNH